LSNLPQPGSKSVAVLGGGVAGLSAACALVEAGHRVHLIERRSYLGGRASSYHHPGVSEYIDNCQHVLFGCCTNLIAFYERIGVANRIYWTNEMTMVEPGGRRSLLGSSSLPAPLHGLPHLLSAKAFSLADKLALARAFKAILRLNPKSSSTQLPLSEWLALNGQTPGAISRFWRLVIASALNAELDSISVPYAAKVVRELFMNSAEAGSMGMSTVALSDLYAGAARFVTDRGSEIRFSTNIDYATWNESLHEWSLHSRTGSISADYLVLALPFEAMAKLVPNMPAAPGATALATQLEAHEHWPICSVHLWFDREITDLDHAVLLDREIHWMFNKSRMQPWRKAGACYIELVVSTSKAFAALERNEAIEQSLAELAEFFPAVKSAKVVKAALVKEVRATFGVPPGVDTHRPAATQSPWPNSFLAGDWTQTGWPSTMESAARSGHLAAEAVCASLGAPKAFLAPDLKPKGLMTFFRS
jgi:zeta-carotene desaturase